VQNNVFMLLIWYLLMTLNWKHEFKHFSGFLLVLLVWFLRSHVEKQQKGK